MTERNPEKHLRHHERIGFAGKLARFFLKNREFSVLTIITVAVGGLFSFVLLPKQYNPEIVAPAFLITTDFPEASANEVYEFITRPMEDRLRELPAVDEISSQSIAGGKSIVTVRFVIGSDRENAKVSLNQKLRDNINEKPIGALEPTIQSIDPDDVPILDIGLTSETLSESSLRKLGIDLADELKRVSGISRIEIKGGRTNHLQVEADSEKLSAYGLSINDLVVAIKNGNGALTLETLPRNDRNATIDITGAIETAEELSSFIVRERDGRVVRLSDVAAVSIGPGDITNFVRITDRKNSTPIVHVALSKLKGENSTIISANIRAALAESETRIIPDGVTVSVLRDEGQTAADEIGKLTGNLLQSIAIVGMVLYVFLGFRNALVVSVAIPLTILSVFAIGLLFGQTINRITLFALILSLGLLVDNATVVVENINRLLRERPNERIGRTIIAAVDEVGMSLLMSTITTLLAFFPMAFVTGMMGPYMGPIPFFVPAALIASLLIALTINPFLSFVLATSPKLRRTPSTEKKEGIFVRSVHMLETRYERILGALLDQKHLRDIVLISVFGLFLAALILPLSTLVPFRMLPKADKEQFFLLLDLPIGTGIARTDALARELETLILRQKNVISVESFVGTAPVIDFNGLFKGNAARTSEHEATLRANLTHHDGRDETSEEIASSTRTAIQTFVSSYPDANIKIVEDPPGPPVLSTFLLKIRGADDEKRERIARDFEDVARHITGVTDLDTTIPERGFDSTYRINIEKSLRLGITPTDIAGTIRTALSGTSVGLFHGTTREGLRKPEQEFISIRLARDGRDEERDFRMISIRAKNGSLIPLSELLTVEHHPFVRSVFSDEREPATYVSGEMEKRSVVYAMIDILPKLVDYRLPDTESHLVSRSLFGATYEDTRTGMRYTIDLDGEWKLTLEVFRDLGIAMGVAVFLIYFVLVAQFRSLRIPLLIMATIPLALIGVLPGFAILFAVKGTYFNATSMIGVIALSGIVVNNAIIYLEYLAELRRNGAAIRDALISAGRTRLLPILLTSITTILGSLTIISDPVWEGLAWSIVFGLALSTVLTLIILPLLYFIFERKHWDRHMPHDHHF